MALGKSETGCFLLNTPILESPRAILALNAPFPESHQAILALNTPILESPRAILALNDRHPPMPAVLGGHGGSLSTAVPRRLRASTLIGVRGVEETETNRPGVAAMLELICKRT